MAVRGVIFIYKRHNCFRVAGSVGRYDTIVRYGLFIHITFCLAQLSPPHNHDCSKPFSVCLTAFRKSCSARKEGSFALESPTFPTQSLSKNRSLCHVEQAKRSRNISLILSRRVVRSLDCARDDRKYLPESCFSGESTQENGDRSKRYF